MRPAGSPQSLQHRRERAVQMLKDGHQPHEVAAKLNVDRQSVRRWRAPIDNKAPRPCGPSPPPEDRPNCRTGNSTQPTFFAPQIGLYLYGYQ